MFGLKNVIKDNRAWILPLSVMLARFFYDRKYIRGRHFEGSFGGLRWVLKGLWQQKILGFNRNIPWPCGHNVFISNPKNIEFHPDDLNNFQSPGTYFQNFSGKIILKRGCYIGPNVGIITANHSLDNLEEHEHGQDVVVGENSWIGMNAILLPGVILGSQTIVGAGAVVTKSFPHGKLVVGGNPARVIRKLERPAIPPSQTQ
ncbi:MAG: DapH/DapD/GlmU-related protein [Pseudomonadota bacterium]